MTILPVIAATTSPRRVLSATIGLLCAGLAAGASAAVLSVGPGKPYAAPCRAIAAAAAGDVIEITGGVTYSGDVCGIYAANLTIRGVNGRPKIDAAGRNAMGKAIWVVIGNNVTIDNVEMYGAKVQDRNGAALRLEGTHFTLRRSFLHDNENGILSGVNTASDILIENSEFGHNGYGTGQTHNLYIGTARTLTFRYNFSHDANVGHNLKSRALTNNILYNRFSSLAAGQTGSTAAGQPSYEVDLPNGGLSYVIGNVIEQPAANQNNTLLAYGEEGATNASQYLYVINNTFLNDDTRNGVFIRIGSGVTVPALIQNNIFAGTGTLTSQTTAVQKTNYRSIAPGFVNRATYDLRPTANPLVIDAGSAPGVSVTGAKLTPTMEYKHVALPMLRPVSGAIDIGAYESTSPAP